jgi:hypothetical protein
MLVVAYEIPDYYFIPFYKYKYYMAEKNTHHSIGKGHHEYRVVCEWLPRSLKNAVWTWNCLNKI